MTLLSLTYEDRRVSMTTDSRMSVMGRPPVDSVVKIRRSARWPLAISQSFCGAYCPWITGGGGTSMPERWLTHENSQDFASTLAIVLADMATQPAAAPHSYLWVALAGIDNQKPRALAIAAGGTVIELGGTADRWDSPDIATFIPNFGALCQARHGVVNDLPFAVATVAAEAAEALAGHLGSSIGGPIQHQQFAV